MRFHIKGLPANISDEDIKSKFKSFGTVTDVDLHCLQDRGFAYVEIDFANTEQDMKRFMKLWNNNVKWAGNLIQVEPAKCHHLQRLQQERDTAEVDQDPLGPRKRVWHMAVESFDIPNDDLSQQKYWKKLKDGRVVRSYRMRVGPKIKIIDFTGGKHAKQHLYFDDSQDQIEQDHIVKSNNTNAPEKSANTYSVRQIKVDGNLKSTNKAIHPQKQVDISYDVVIDCSGQSIIDQINSLENGSSDNMQADSDLEDGSLTDNAQLHEQDITELVQNADQIQVEEPFKRKIDLYALAQKSPLNLLKAEAEVVEVSQETRQEIDQDKDMMKNILASMIADNSGDFVEDQQQQQQNMYEEDAARNRIIIRPVSRFDPDQFISPSRLSSKNAAATDKQKSNVQQKSVNGIDPLCSTQQEKESSQQDLVINEQNNAEEPLIDKDSSAAVKEPVIIRGGTYEVDLASMQSLFQRGKVSASEQPQASFMLFEDNTPVCNGTADGDQVADDDLDLSLNLAGSSSSFDLNELVNDVRDDNILAAAQEQALQRAREPEVQKTLNVMDMMEYMAAEMSCEKLSREQVTSEWLKCRKYFKKDFKLQKKRATKDRQKQYANISADVEDD
ncbi:hypothetical protein MP228_001172 [Amoeboaphelidium protococcarum]|nr:hypothetical protein MP228_001172 [Amoeboaphelidium protococcarum]